MSWEKLYLIKETNISRDSQVLSYYCKNNAATCHKSFPWDFFWDKRGFIWTGICFKILCNTWKRNYITQCWKDVFLKTRFCNPEDFYVRRQSMTSSWSEERHNIISDRLNNLIFSFASVGMHLWLYFFSYGNVRFLSGKYHYFCPVNMTILKNCYKHGALKAPYDALKARELNVALHHIHPNTFSKRKVVH